MAATETILPPPCFSIAGTTARAVRSTEPAFNSIMLRKISSEVSCTGSPMWKPPAMLHSTSMRPNRASAFCTAAATAAPSARSAATRSRVASSLPKRAAKRLRLEIEQHHARACRRERSRHGAAQRPRRTGNHRHASFAHRDLPPVSAVPVMRGKPGRPVNGSMPAARRIAATTRATGPAELMRRQSSGPGSASY